MFNFARALVTAAIVLAAVQAVPTNNVNVLGARDAQEDGHLFVCDAFNFQGNCENLEFNAGQCINFQPEFQDDISSWGPDNGFSCTLFVAINCVGDSLTGSNPGFSTLTPEFNDQFSSFKCSFN